MEAMMTTVGMYTVKLEPLGDNYRVQVTAKGGHYEGLMRPTFQEALTLFKARVNELRRSLNA
ncbi:hypothetical protein PR08_gp43 [Idiomarinaceae phage Phi1M2-2]|uniref:hypothetical protein n=1 Tax=Idiomarinaceae phage Phi1M2-2 TaxID=1527515 RepID=UPI0004F63913|nr:hypothetical protein PR08_gp43 [Idiomarinaceae phage Phi1M2-2]AIM40800.1 hypothetical protein M22_043 [Idiomarinaceae phage Phi1M2-2]